MAIWQTHSKPYLARKFRSEVKRLAVILVGLLFFQMGVQAQSPTAPYVVLVSFDGFRHDYVKNFNPPHFLEFIANGSRAEAMIPSYPSKTFPNHYSLVTGLVPGHHGLVDNTFYDRPRNEKYGMNEKKDVVDPYYYGGIPIWQLAQQQGMKSASYFWVGSEMSDELRRPTYYFPFDDSVKPEARVQQVFDWLRLPESERPHIITLYFSFPDHEGHDSGPNSQETKQAVLRADSLLGQLMKGLSEIKLPVNVLVVADHGMSELTVQEDTFIFLDELINRKDSSIIIANGGTQTHLYFTQSAKEDSVYRVLKSKEKNFKIYKKEDLPHAWNFQADRVGDLLLTATPGHYIREGSRAAFLKRAPIGKKFGVHGYDPAQVPDMNCIFYASGPNIKKGVLLPPFQNIHVFPLLAKILGLHAPAVDGKESVLLEIYKD